MGTQRLQHLPDHLVCLAVAQRHFRRHAGRDPDRQDHIPEVLALRATHHPAHGLDNVDDALARLQEQHGVERGHVDALGQALGVREHAADALPGLIPEPRQSLGAHLDVGPAVDVVGLDPHRVGVAAILEHLVRDRGEGPRECLRRLDRRRERDRALHRHLAASELRTALGECVPAADDAGEVIEREPGLGIGQLALERAVDGLLVHREDDHPVVGEQVAGDYSAEPQLVEDRTERGLVVHRGQHHIGLLGLRLRLVAIDPRRRRHVEPARAGDVRVVVDPREHGLIACIPEGAGGAMRFVADDQVEGAQSLLLSASDHVQRLVGREHHRHRIGTDRAATRATSSSGLVEAGNARSLTLMSSSLVRFPTWMSEQTAKVARWTVASFAHSRTDCESRLMEGTMKSADPPGPTSRSAARREEKVLPSVEGLFVL